MESQTEESKMRKPKGQNKFKKKRCKVCRKKCKFSAASCKCEEWYCDAHRLPFDHDCTFDWKGFYNSTLKKRNPKILHEKMVDKI